MYDMIFKGLSANALGIIVTRLPDIVTGAENGEWLDIAGRDGGVFRGDGTLKNVTLSVDIYVPPEADMFAVTALLSGSGTLRFSKWPWFWHARLDGGIAIKDWLDLDAEGWTGSIKFTALPHRYVYPEATISAMEGMALINPGNAAAYPEIRIQGTGDITVGFSESGSILIDDLDGGIVIDCADRIAYDPETGASMTHKLHIVSGSDGHGWPCLHPGTPAVGWSGSVTVCTIKPRWRNQ